MKPSVIIIFLFSFSICAFEGLFQVEHLSIEDILLKNSLPRLSESTSVQLKTEINDFILEDKGFRIDDQFNIPKEFLSSVKFWFLIYGIYSSEEVVIHDKANLGIIYDAIDFTHLKDRSKSFAFSRPHLQSSMAQAKIKKIKKALAQLSLNPSAKDDVQKSVLQSLKRAGISLPKAKKKRQQIVKNLIYKIRAQTGQKDFVLKGIHSFIPYSKFLEQVAIEKKIPEELIAIPFVESSFNQQAESKVGASGVWQIMPSIAPLVFPKMAEIDYRDSIVLSTYAALSLLKENFQNLKRWDLAITAYNSGTGHLQRAKRHLRKKNIKKFDLSTILKYHHNKKLGFATKNFYSEILAMIHVLFYRDLVFPKHDDFFSANAEIDLNQFRVYALLCPFPRERLLTMIDKKIQKKVFPLNDHLKEKIKILKEGTLLVGPEGLSNDYVQEISKKDLAEKFPRKWNLRSASQSCSTI